MHALPPTIFLVFLELAVGGFVVQLWADWERLLSRGFVVTSTLILWVFAALGLWIRVSAMRQLGARFSPLVALQRDHALETTGWYSHVRHPGYLGSLLASLGAAISFGSALALPLFSAMVWFQWRRVRHEERVLAGRFGELWRAYAARTGALLPRFLGR